MEGVSVTGKDTAGGACAGTRTGWYRVENAGVTLEGDPVSGHGEGPHARPTITKGKDWYRVAGIPVAFEGAPASCGHVSTGRTWYGFADGVAATRLVAEVAPRKGTYFFGGAGMGGAYIGDILSKLREAGISPALAGNAARWSAGEGEPSLFGMMADAVAGVPMLRDGEDTGRDIGLADYGTAGAQFNLIGYSFGSLVAAQVAIKYSQSGGGIDHLVLIGSPISQDFLDELRASPGIGQVVVHDLTHVGDPIYAGIPLLELIGMGPLLAIEYALGDGHFWYSAMTEDGDLRRRHLAASLYEAGLR